MINDELKAHAAPTLGKVVLGGLIVMIGVSGAMASYDAWLDRRVVDYVEIESASYDGLEFCFSGAMYKNRECPLASNNPYDAVTFWRYSGAGRSNENLSYEFRGEKSTRHSRPAGVTNVSGWCVTAVDKDPRDINITAFATHKCGVRSIGPTEFMSVNVGEVLERLDQGRTVIARE